MFEVGDTVRIRNDLQISKKYNDVYFVKSMMQYQDKEATIINTTYDGHFCLDIDNGRFVWSRGMMDCLSQKTYRTWERSLSNAV